MSEENKWTEEEVLTAIGEMGNGLSELFMAEAKNLMLKMDSESLGMQKAYLACAEACVKATTRKMIIDIQTFTPKISFRIPAEAKP